MTTFLLLFLALALLYYYKEKNRLFQEQKVQNRLAFIECKNLQKISSDKDECKMQIIEKVEHLDDTYMEILIAFGMWILFVSPVGYILSKISLRPIRQSVEIIDTFTNGIIHDINTPLSIIKLNAQSMKNHLKDPKLHEKNMRILQAIDDVESLEEQLLFTLKSSRYQLKQSNFDLYELLLNRLEYYKNIRDTVEISLIGNSLLIHADKVILLRMIDNIVLNAIKYSHRNSKVNISLTDTILVIEDYAQGIKNPKKVFLKYYREDLATKGLGLGLFIVQSVAQLHALEIQLDSTINVGTKFSIDFKDLEVS